MRVLISNDDGVYAPGIAVLEKITASITSDIWVIAPENNQSAVAHSLSIKSPIKIHQISERKYSVNGTPTDSVLIGIESVLKETMPDWVFSGINNGGNLGEDITYSGTVAAAMEAAIFGVPAIAFSQNCVLGQTPKWETALAHGATVIKKLIQYPFPKGVFTNVNFPDCSPEEVKGTRVVRQGQRPPYKYLIDRVDPLGRPYFWIGPTIEQEALEDDTDLSAIQKHYITITPLHLDFTHHDTLAKMETLTENWNA